METIQPTTIQVKISPDVELAYKKLKKVGGGEGKIWLSQDLWISVPITNVVTTNSKYFVLPNFDETNQNSLAIEFTVPANTSVMGIDSLELTLAKDQVVCLPKWCQVELKPENKVPQNNRNLENREKKE